MSENPNDGDGLVVRAKKVIENKSCRLSGRMSTVHKNITIQTDILIQISRNEPMLPCLFMNQLPPRSQRKRILLAIFEFFVPSLR